MATVPSHHVHYTWSEYLALEASSNIKHEYLDGQIYAMAGGTPEHAAVAATVIGLLFAQLRQGRCRAYDADLRVRVRATGLATYPDVTVVCGKRELDPDDERAVTNPTLIVEVPSPSTEEQRVGPGGKGVRRNDRLVAVDAVVAHGEGGHRGHAIAGANAKDVAPHGVDHADRVVPDARR
jgi:hypothetical protein